MAVHFPFLRGTGQRRFDDTMPSDPFTREKFTKERSARQEAIREYFKRYPNEKFQTEVESWREPQSQNIEFTMKRLREPIEKATEIAK
jgi:hypothetical protein